MCNQGKGSAICKMSFCVVMRTIHAVVHLVGRGASFLIGKSVWVDGEAEAWSLDTVLGLRLVELILGPSFLLLLPLLPLLPPVTSLLGTFWAELRHPWGRLRGGAPSASVFAALYGCCSSNLPTNQSTNIVVIATSRLSQRHSLTGVEDGSWEQQQQHEEPSKPQTPSKNGCMNV